jgi:diguanylate cyclase (GGDEF)-like protein
VPLTTGSLLDCDPRCHGRADRYRSGPRPPINYVVAPASRKLPRLLSAHANTYEGADAPNAVRLVAIITALSGILTVVYLAFDPPTDPLGYGGWAIAGAVVLAEFALAASLLRRVRSVGFGALLGISYLGLVSVAVLVWLAGSAESPYTHLYLLWVGSAVGVHPPRRALAFLAATAAIAALPLVYEGWSSGAASYIATSYLIWAAIATLLMLLMISVRAQRVRLRAEEEHAQRLARADSLTGLGNRRAFDEALTAEVARVRRVGSTVSVALVDIDGFKDLNDRYGHLEGDRCLKEVAEAITDSTRGGDRAFRWGGDEIVLVFPDTAYEGARGTMSRIALGISEGVSGPDEQGVAVSWGVAELTADMTPADLLSRADLELIAAKPRSPDAGRLGSSA